jgi:hypothetical protein
LTEEELEILSQARLLNEGITDDITVPENIICNEYTDEDIKHDYEAVDWESAFEEVERIEDEKIQA